MTAFADGFLAYHIEVEVEDGRAPDVAHTIKGWKTAFRNQGTWPGFPQTMVDQLSGLGGVTNVVCEGPQSSLLIPLRLIKGMSGVECTMSTVLGVGAVSQAIEDSLTQWSILTTGRRLTDVDSPLEISLREPGGQHESVMLYPTSRSRYRSQLTQPDAVPAQFLCNRFNQGIATVAQAVNENGGIVSFRPRALGRYDSLDGYVSLLTSTRHLVLSSRHRMLKQFARLANIETQATWPAGSDDLLDSSARNLAQWLLQRMPPGAIVVLVRYPGNDAAFFCDGLDAVAVQAPAGYGPESRAARIQGALLGETAKRMPNHTLFRDQTTWDSWANAIVARAFRGTVSRPWRY